jgi:hypothetical protein
MLRIWLMAMCAAATLMVARDLQVFHRAGLVGYCTTSPRPAGTTGSWRACQKGTLDGRPDLSRQSCTRRGLDGKVEYWSCPARVVSGPTAAGR